MGNEMSFHGLNAFRMVNASSASSTFGAQPPSLNQLQFTQLARTMAEAQGKDPNDPKVMQSIMIELMSLMFGNSLMARWLKNLFGLSNSLDSEPEDIMPSGGSSGGGGGGGGSSGGGGSIAAPGDPNPGGPTQQMAVARPGYAPDGRLTEEHPDYNLDIRGHSLANVEKGLVDYGGPTDSKAPQLASLFSKEHGMPKISNVYHVNDWNWDTMQRNGPIQRPDAKATMVGFETRPGENLFLPISGYKIDGEGHMATVLYQDEDSLVLNYTADGFSPGGGVGKGYSIHIEGIKTDPNLKEGSKVRVSQLLGQAQGNEVRVSVRDTGNFMDPRARKDWWHDNRQPDAPAFSDPKPETVAT